MSSPAARPFNLAVCPSNIFLGFPASATGLFSTLIVNDAVGAISLHPSLLTDTVYVVVSFGVATGLAMSGLFSPSAGDHLKWVAFVVSTLSGTASPAQMLTSVSEFTVGA